MGFLLYNDRQSVNDRRFSAERPQDDDSTAACSREGEKAAGNLGSGQGGLKTRLVHLVDQPQSLERNPRIHELDDVSLLGDDLAQTASILTKLELK